MFSCIRRFVMLAALLASAALASAQSGVPVVTQVADQDTTWHFYRHDEPVTLHVDASNSPTSFSATGVPPGVTFTNDSFSGRVTGVFSWTYGGLGGGAYTVSVTATNAAGTSAPMTFRWIVHPGMDNFIFTDKRSYGAGEVITFTTHFSAPVVVTGTPSIPLWGTKRALYAGGSGTATLTFTYQVAADDPSASGLYYATIDANGGSITTSDGVAASLQDSYQGLGDYPYFSIATGPDTTPPAKPVITSYDTTSSTPSFRGTTEPGTAVDVVPMSSASPLHAVVDSSGNWNANWSGAPLDAGPHDFYAVAIDQAGNRSPSTALVTVNVPPTSPPVVTQIPDQELTWHFYRHDQFNFLHVSASNAPTRFSATGMPPGVDFTNETFNGRTSGVFSWTYYPLTGGAYTVAVTASNAVGTSAPMTFRWIVHPGMKDFLATDKRSYAPGEVITFTANFSAPVVVTGTPYIPLWGTKRALYAGGSGTATLTFTYQVAQDDPPASGLYYDTINAGGGTIATTDGVSASLQDSYQGLGNFPYFSITGGTTTPTLATPVITQASGALYPTVRGTGTPGAIVTVSVTSSASTQQPRSTTVGSDGAWQVSWANAAASDTPTFWPAGTYTFTARAANGAGQQSASSSPVTWQAVSHADLPAPVITGITPDTWTPGDGITSAHDVTVFGTAQPNTRVILLANHSPYVVVTADANGQWSHAETNLDQLIGDLVLSAIAWDGADRASAESATFRITSASAPFIADSRLPHFTVGTAVSFDLRTITLGSNGAGERPMPLSYRSSDLPAGVTLSSAGVLSGTPAQAGTFTAHIATMAYADPQPVTFVVDPSTNPPPTNNPPPTTTPAKTNQTITFASPVSALIVGQPITLGATSSAGLPITYSVVSGNATISGNVLTATSTANLVVRAASAGSDSVNAAFTDVTFGNPQKAAQAITLGTSGGAVPAERAVTLAATASSGLPVTYTVVSGPATITGNTLTFTGTGSVVVRAAQAGDGTYAAASDATLTFTANPVDRLINISSRLRVGAGASGVAIAGFVVTGSAPKPILLRAIGPGLSAFGIRDGAAAPQLQLTDSTGKLIASNNGWANDALIAATGDRLGAFRLAADSQDAALLVTLSPGAYTAQVTAPAAGSVLIEVYDAAATAAVPTRQLINISTRGAVDATAPLIGGFVVSGAQTKRVLIRAIGPGLTPFGVAGALVDPVVKIYDATGTLIAQNDNWESAQTVATMPAPATAAQITAADTATGAFALQGGAKDAAALLTLAPGSYTAVVTGVNGASGTALVEIYEAP